MMMPLEGGDQPVPAPLFVVKVAFRSEHMLCVGVVVQRSSVAQASRVVDERVVLLERALHNAGSTHDEVDESVGGSNARAVVLGEFQARHRHRLH